MGLSLLGPVWKSLRKPKSGTEIETKIHTKISKSTITFN